MQSAVVGDGTTESLRHGRLVCRRDPIGRGHRDPEQWIKGAVGYGHCDAVAVDVASFEQDAPRDRICVGIDRRKTSAQSPTQAARATRRGPTGDFLRLEHRAEERQEQSEKQRHSGQGGVNIHSGSGVLKGGIIACEMRNRDKAIWAYSTRCQGRSAVTLLGQNLVKRLD